MAIVAISGAFTLALTLAYSLYIQGYTPYAFSFPLLKTVELSQLKGYLWYGVFYFLGLAFIFHLCSESPKNEKACETAIKGFRISTCAVLLLLFCISFSAPVEIDIKPISEVSNTAKFEALVPFNSPLVNDGSMKTSFQKEVALSDNPILDLSNVPLTAIAALWIVLFLFFNRYIRDCAVCDSGKISEPEMGIIERLVFGFCSFVSNNSEHIINFTLIVANFAIIGFAVYFFVNNPQWLFLFLGALGLIASTLTIMVKLYENDIAEFTDQMRNIHSEEKPVIINDVCQLDDYERTDEQEFNDLYDFLELHGLDTEFDKYQKVRDGYRRN